MDLGLPTMSVIRIPAQTSLVTPFSEIFQPPFHCYLWRLIFGVLCQYFASTLNPLHLSPLQCLQTADGMAFLHSAKTPLLHRDLRCANILVDKNDAIKVCL